MLVAEAAAACVGHAAGLGLRSADDLLPKQRGSIGGRNCDGPGEQQAQDGTEDFAHGTLASVAAIAEPQGASTITVLNSRTTPKGADCYAPAWPPISTAGCWPCP